MKGVSTFLAAVLLIAFTLGIATLIFGFLTGSIKDVISTTTNRSQEGTNCASASIEIQDVYISGASGSSNVNVVVKNIGFTNELVIQDAQVFNKTGSNFTTRNLPYYHFNRGNVLTLTFTNVSFSNFTCPQGFDKATVTTTCGSVQASFSGTPKC